MRPIETKYKGCRFRSRLEARWAVFFDALGIKWWYEPEGFMMRFDYEAFALDWDMSEEGLLEEGIPQTFKHLDGKEYMYLPDFYLPELNYWIEVKGPNPTKEELEKSFMLSKMLREAGNLKIETAKTEAEIMKALNDTVKQGIFILYGDVPWPYPQKGNIFGYGGRDVHGTTFGEFFEGIHEQEEVEYRSLLMGRLNLSWQECPLCSKVGIGKFESPYCTSCYDRMANFVLAHLVEDWDISEGASLTQLRWAAVLGMETPQKAYEATKGLMNQPFFTSGHKTRKLQEAYEAARSARFEHKRA